MSLVWSVVAHPGCVRYQNAEAEFYAAEIRWMIEREGAAAFNLSAAVRVEASRAVEKLTPHGATISEAVDFLVDSRVNRF